MPSLMSVEIAEQQAAVLETTRQLHLVKERISRLRLESIRRVLFIARGTSDNVAQYGNFLIPVLTGVESYSLSPSLLNAYGVEFDLTDTLVIGISQSGQTSEIVGAMKLAKRMGARTIGITNSQETQLELATEFCFITPAGPELAVPATKTYTTALVALAGVAALIFKNEELLRAIDEVPSIIAAQLSQLSIDSAVVEKLASATTAVFAGRGLALGAAFEAALKLKETSGINAIGTSVADLVHGPIAALSESVPLVVMSADIESAVYPGLQDLVARAQQLNAPIITIGDFLPDDRGPLSVKSPRVYLGELLAPILLAIPSQRLALDVALKRGLDPDAPSGLKKVTQTV